MEPLNGKLAGAKAIFRAAGEYGRNLRTHPGRKDVDQRYSPEWTLGGCFEENCMFEHNDAKISADYVGWLCTAMQSGADKIKTNPAGWKAASLCAPVRGEGESSRNQLHT